MDKSRGFQRLAGPHEPYSRRSGYFGMALFYFRSIPVVRWTFLARDAMPLSAKGSQLNLLFLLMLRQIGNGLVRSLPNAFVWIGKVFGCNGHGASGRWRKWRYIWRCRLLSGLVDCFSTEKNYTSRVG